MAIAIPLFPIAGTGEAVSGPGNKFPGRLV